MLRRRLESASAVPALLTIVRADWSASAPVASARTGRFLVDHPPAKVGNPHKSKRAMTDGKMKVGEQGMRLLLGKLGYPKHKHVGVIEQLTGLSRGAATRKLTGLSPWDINEYASNCEKLGSNIFDVLAAVEAETLTPATLVSGDEKQPCLIRLGAMAEAGDAYHFMATQKQLNWYVERMVQPPPQGARLVEKLIIPTQDPTQGQPAKTVAVLDDDRDVCDTLCDGLALDGFKAIPFYDLNSFLASLDDSHYDAFVMDWMLSAGTAEDALIAIRERHLHEPIALLTGKAADLGVQIGRLTACLTKYDARYFTKPTPIPVITEALRRSSES